MGERVIPSRASKQYFIMLSNVNPALPSPQRPELVPPLAPYDYGHHNHRPLPSAAACAARRSADHNAGPEADVPPEHNIQKRIAPAPTPPRHKPELLHQHQHQHQHQPQQHQPQRPHGFNSPRPALSPLSEYHSGFSDADYTPSHSHRRQQSLSNLLPLAFRSRTPSPTRNPPQLPEPMPYTGEGRSGPRGDTPKGGGLTGWFNMSSTQEDNHHTPNTTPTQLRRRPTTTSHPTTPKNNTAASRFMSALSSKFTGTTTPSTPASPLIDDEICTLNIEAALFPPTSTPTSPTSSRDTFSPAAFKNLEMNALGLLTKMQSAYRDRVATLKEIEAEKLAQREELEEAETRNRHLKMQLEGMARKAQDQEQEMARLVEELAKARAEAAERRPFPPASSEGSVVCSEDLGVDEERRRRRAWARRSGETAKSSEAGGGVETDDDESAESESVFSRCRSPTLTISGHMEGEGVPSQRGLLAPPRARVQQPPQPPQPQPQLSAFQKIIKGIAGDAEETNGCSNCRGRDASVAWDTLSVLRDENKHLKVRMGELEVAVEGALDLVNGIGL